MLLRRWRNTLGRTMWDFPGGRTGGNRYLVLGLGTGRADDLAADLAVPPGRDELIAYGPLLSDDGAAWLGTAALLRAPDPSTALAVLTADRYAAVEVHTWRFGGRPSSTEDIRAGAPPRQAPPLARHGNGPGWKPARATGPLSAAASSARTLPLVGR